MARTLSSSGRRALVVIDAMMGSCLLEKFVPAFWSEQEAGRKWAPGFHLLEALAEEGYVAKTITFGRHGPIYLLTEQGKEALSQPNPV